MVVNLIAHTFCTVVTAATTALLLLSQATRSVADVDRSECTLMLSFSYTYSHTHAYAKHSCK